MEISPQSETVPGPARTVTAFFIQQVTLTVSKNLIGNLPADGGTLSPAVDMEHIYDIGAEVNLWAKGDTGRRCAGGVLAIQGMDGGREPLPEGAERVTRGTFCHWDVR